MTRACSAGGMHGGRGEESEAVLRVSDQDRSKTEREMPSRTASKFTISEDVTIDELRFATVTALTQVHDAVLTSNATGDISMCESPTRGQRATKCIPRPRSG